jgi:hypothetical protein
MARWGRSSSNPSSSNSLFFSPVPGSGCPSPRGGPPRDAACIPRHPVHDGPGGHGILPRPRAPGGRSRRYPAPPRGRRARCPPGRDLFQARRRGAGGGRTPRPHESPGHGVGWAGDRRDRGMPLRPRDPLSRRAPPCTRGHVPGRCRGASRPAGRGPPCPGHRPRGGSRGRDPGSRRRSRERPGGRRHEVAPPVQGGRGPSGLGKGPLWTVSSAPTGRSTSWHGESPETPGRHPTRKANWRKASKFLSTEGSICSKTKVRLISPKCPPIRSKMAGLSRSKANILLTGP